MGAATRDRPKGMVRLHGRPLIAWQLEALRSQGIEDVAIVRGYRGDTLTFDVTYFENPRWSETGIVSSLARAESWLTAGPTIVSYADIVYAADALRQLLQVPGDLALTYDTNWLELWQRRFDDPLSDAETFRVDGEGLLREIGRRPERLEQVGGQYMGLLRLTPHGALRLLGRYHALEAGARERIDMTALLDILIREGELVQTAPFAGWWCEIDSLRDLTLAEEIVQPPGGNR